MPDGFKQGKYDIALGVSSRWNEEKSQWELYLPFFDEVIVYKASGDMVSDVCNCFSNLDGFYHNIQ